MGRNSHAWDDRKTTEAVTRAKERRKNSKELLIQEAKGLGVTVPELKQRKFVEGQRIIEGELRRRKEQEKMAMERSRQEQRRRWY